MVISAGLVLDDKVFEREIDVLQRATHGLPAAFQNMGIDLRGFQGRMPQLLLHRTNVQAVFECMGRKGMSQRM